MELHTFHEKIVSEITVLHITLKILSYLIWLEKGKNYIPN